jgi:hypothetical protein
MDPFNALSDVAIVERLLRFAFVDRKIPNHNGHGLLATQIRAGQWIGAVDVFTLGASGTALRVASRGLAPAKLESSEKPLALPDTQGTLVHVMFQGVDSSADRAAASKAEQLPFEEENFDKRAEAAFALAM